MKKRNKKITNNKIRDLLLNQKGMALLTTLIFIFILVTFGVALLSMTSNDLKLSALQRDSTKAFYIAEAGIERTLFNLKEDYKSSKDWNDDSIINSYTLSGDINGFRKIGYDPTGGYDVQFGEGTYTVYLIDLTSNNVTIKSKGVYNKTTRYVQVDAGVGPLSIWDNAIFAGSGASGRVINGNVDIRGSVHLLGEVGEDVMEIEVDIGGTGGIGNNYLLMDSDLRSRVTDIPIIDGVETLSAKLYVKKGKVNLSGAATVGNPNVPENDRKELMDGVFIDDGGDDGFGGNQGEDNVYSDNGTQHRYPFRDSFEFPDLYEDDYIDVETGGTINDLFGVPYKYDGYYNSDNTLKITDISSITSDTESFHYPDDVDKLPDEKGNYIEWDQETQTLTISGIIVIEGVDDFAIGKKGDLIEYEGKEVGGTMRKGTIVSKHNISIHSDLLAKNSFPTSNALGLIAYNDLNLATGHGDSQLKMIGAFYAQRYVISAKQNQIAGTFVSNCFDMGTNVPSIYQVPGLEFNLPPGMPGAEGPPILSISNWHEVHK